MSRRSIRLAGGRRTKQQERERIDQPYYRSSRWVMRIVQRTSIATVGSHEFFSGLPIRARRPPAPTTACTVSVAPMDLAPSVCASLQALRSSSGLSIAHSPSSRASTSSDCSLAIDRQQQEPRTRTPAVAPASCHSFWGLQIDFPPVSSYSSVEPVGASIAGWWPGSELCIGPPLALGAPSFLPFGADRLA